MNYVNYYELVLKLIILSFCSVIELSAHGHALEVEASRRFGCFVFIVKSQIQVELGLQDCCEVVEIRSIMQVMQ